jgi:nucleoside-diphosphate-sugar epimerase
MRVFVAGASGAIGRRIVGRLVGAGHRVAGLTRSSEKVQTIEGLGASALIGDALDGGRMDELFAEFKPEGVVQVLNALQQRGPMRPSEMNATNEMRTKGTRNLLAAALAHGTRRYVAESMVFIYGYGDHGPEPVDEDHPVMTNTEFEQFRPALDALVSLERQVLDASAGSIEGVVLRYGLFYGPGIGSTEFMAKLLKRRLFGLPGGGTAIGSWIHIDDGAAAAVAALESDRSGEIYNVVDDEPTTLRAFATELAARRGLPKPYRVPMWTTRLMGKQMQLTATSRLPVSNAKIRRELGWRPSYPTYKEGIATLAAMT